MRLLKMLCSCAVFVCLLPACKKNDDNSTPSKKPGTYYQLPQGNAAFDQQILDWYKKYDTYVLYRFTEKEFKYGITGFYPQAVLCKTADTTSMPAAINFLKNYWFSFYTDDFLKKYLPFKILLAGLMMESNNGFDTTNIPVTRPMAGLDYIIIPNVDSNFNKMSGQQRQTLKTYLNIIFLKSLFFGSSDFTPAKLIPPAAFFEVSPYDKKGLTDTDKYQYGFLALATDNNNQLVVPGKYDDFAVYLETIISTPEWKLSATLLSTTTDTNGLIRKKYNILIGFFKEQYKIDIRAIADKQD
ncbi:hypothetical protein CLV51_10958 [Chitinophaga niastensis]|uniref:Uncharacterized protein n=1 Tax=Chitinophaga niastensis TaxID=536980 RepID=A0A2P8HA29_CHINA|nr:hypothetical protein [Chitinophaga niastensis]PSL43064.1 hypothetical protein CLV51_10958 [Chitinophaga niastensis]